MVNAVLVCMQMDTGRWTVVSTAERDWWGEVGTLCGGGS